MHQALARLISLVAGFVPNFAVGPPAHVVSAAWLCPLLKCGSRLGLLVSFPEGMVSCKPGPVQFLLGHIVAAVLVL